MEDLQIALNSSRVDQRNQGLWIRAWQVGQTLQALVVDKLPSNATLLRINGNHLVVPADIPAQKGARLMLEVSHMVPTPTLRLLETQNPALPTAHLALLSKLTQKLIRQARVLIPKQGKLSSSLLSLFGVQSVVNVPAIESIRKSVPSAQELQNTQEFEEAVLQMGSFFSEEYGQENLKEMLMQLYAALMEGRGALGINEHDDSRKLSDQIEAGLARIALNHAATLQAQEAGIKKYYFDLPLWFGEKLVEANCLIVQEPSEPIDQTLGSSERWKLCLQMDLPRAGIVTAEVALHGQRVSVAICAENSEFLDVLDSQLPALDARLGMAGVPISVVCCRETMDGYPSPLEQFPHNLEEIA